MPRYFLELYTDGSAYAHDSLLPSKQTKEIREYPAGYEDGRGAIRFAIWCTVTKELLKFPETVVTEMNKQFVEDGIQFAWSPEKARLSWRKVTTEEKIQALLEQ